HRSLTLAKYAFAIEQVHDGFRTLSSRSVPCQVRVEVILVESVRFLPERHTSERRHQRFLARTGNYHPVRREFLVRDSILPVYLARLAPVLARKRLAQGGLQDPPDATHPPADVRGHAVVFVQATQDRLEPLDDSIVRLVLDP